MEYEQKPSIYQSICDAYEKQPITPYSFQNDFVAGKESISYYFFQENPPSFEKNSYVLKVVHALSKIMNDDNDMNPDEQEVIASSLHYMYADNKVHKRAIKR